MVQRWERSHDVSAQSITLSDFGQSQPERVIGVGDGQQGSDFAGDSRGIVLAPGVAIELREQRPTP